MKSLCAVRTILHGCIIFAGCSAVAVSGYYLFQDWAALNFYYARFEHLVNSASTMRSLSIAGTQQNAFRINCFADGVGVLLGAILAAIGIHGLLLPQATPPPRIVLGTLSTKNGDTIATGTSRSIPI